MKLAPIALKLRLAETRFGNLIAGAAELSQAISATLKKEMAFVIPISDSVSPNGVDNGINQVLEEKFAVVVALDNAMTDKDKTGLTAYDLVHDVRAEIFRAILGWQIPGTEDVVEYAGGRAVGLTRSNLWYQFDFMTTTRLSDDDGVDVGADELPDFQTIYAQWVLSPSANLPVGGIPVAAFSPDMESIIDLTDDPRAGAFGAGFNLFFETYDKDRRS